MKKLVIIVFLVASGVVTGQSVTGTSGLIHIPSARMLEDGQLVLGAAYIPEGYFSSTSGPNKNLKINPGLNTYITYGILPFVEVMFRYTHEPGIKVNNNTRYFPDRMVSLRFRVLRERKFLPSIVFGFHDFGKLLDDNLTSNSFFSSNYIVGSKGFKTSFGRIDTTFGYAFDFLNIKTKEFQGLFGGISFSPKLYPNASILFEHNSKEFNTGISLSVFSRFNLMLGIWNLDEPTFSFNYLF